VRVLGIDPGSRKIGLAVVEAIPRGVRAVAFATVRLREAELAARLMEIHGAVRFWIERYQPAVGAVEEVFVRKNARSALILGQARGAALVAASGAGLRIEGYAPAAVKSVVGGHGRALKDDMRTMVQKQLGLAHRPSEDAADALAVAMTHILSRQWQARAMVGP
jgi:crossover junction endodeoxyribonuclease RuvC